MDWSKLSEQILAVLDKILGPRNPNYRYRNGVSAYINLNGDTIVTTPLGLNGERVTTLHYPYLSSRTTYESNSGNVRDNEISASTNAEVEKDRQEAKRLLAQQSGGRLTKINGKLVNLPK